MAGRKIGYARTAQKSEAIALQITALEAAGCEQVFSDNGASGILVDHPGLQLAKSTLQAGDTFVVCDPSRLSRNMAHYTEFRRFLNDGEINFLSLDADDSRDDRSGLPDTAALLLHRLNIISAPPSETPIWRKAVYNMGRSLIAFSGCGRVPPAAR